MTWTGLILSLTAACLQAILLRMLIQHKLYREFSFFLIYIAASILMAFVRLSVRNNHALYFYVYWVTEAVYAALGLLVLHQIFRRVFNEFYSYWPRFWMIFPAVAATFTLVSIWYEVQYAPRQPYLATTIIVISGIAVNFMQAGLFALFFLLVRFFAMRWRTYAFAIVLGFALAAMGALTAVWLQSHYRNQFKIFTIYGSSVSYICAVLLWLAVFNRPEPESNWGLAVKPEEFLLELKQYTKILQAFRRRKN